MKGLIFLLISILALLPSTIYGRPDITEKVDVTENKTACSEKTCGVNSQCTISEDLPVCTCLPGYKEDPLNKSDCKKSECAVSSDCSLDLACLSSTCVNPCPGVCGENTQCNVKNHVPICSCLPNHYGDPFFKCTYDSVRATSKETKNSTVCSEFKCGANSQCTVKEDLPVCSCLPEYEEDPINKGDCKKYDCIVNLDCSSKLACINRKCTDPCPGTCGSNATCVVVNYNPVCACEAGRTGDAFIECKEIKN